MFVQTQHLKPVQLPEHSPGKLSGHKSLAKLHFKSEVAYTQIVLSDINNN